MSHFSVLVIGENIAEQLAPFQENNMGDCPDEYLTFNDTEAEMLKEYENEGTEMIVLSDGTMKYKWDEQFKVKKDDFFAPTECKYPEDSVKKEIPYKERFATFEEFVAKYHGCTERDPKTGRYGYWENPNAKWDWYSIGGRWSGFFQMKPDTKGELGKRGVIDVVNGTPDTRAGKADQAFKRDIDFQLMKYEAGYEATKLFDTFDEFTAKYPEFKGWSYFRDSMDIDAARTAYRNQEGFNELEDMLGFTMECWFDTLSIGRETYIKQREAAAFLTFAVVKDGEWYERGKMGWFGMSTNEKDEDKWNEEFMKLLDGLPEDTLLSIVDCHI